MLWPIPKRITILMPAISAPHAPVKIDAATLIGFPIAIARFAALALRAFVLTSFVAQCEAIWFNAASAKQVTWHHDLQC